MKELSINVITNNNQYGLSNDASILVSNLRTISNIEKHFSFKVRPVNFYCSECGTADINFFLELPNPLLIHSGKINILIPNQEWFFKTWIDYLPLFDEIWCKTIDCLNKFKSIIDNRNKVNKENKENKENLSLKENGHYVGWTSLDRLSLKYDKNYEQCIHIAGKSILKGTQHLINCWKEDFPHLHLIYNGQSHEFTKTDRKNISYYSERLNNDELIKLMNSCAIHICPSEAEGYGHYLNEARSCQAIIITTDAEPMKHFSEEKYRLEIAEERIMDKTLGIQYFFKDESLDKLMYQLKQDITNNTDHLKEIGKIARQNYLQDSKLFRQKLSKRMASLINILDKNKYTPKIPLEISQSTDMLPSISIITLIYNRPNFFNLALMNYKGTDYPEHLLEWIIIDDSDIDKRIGSLIPKDLKNIKYITLDKKTTIGEKRNIAIKNSKNTVIMMMDDDDIYPPRHALIKIAYLLHYKKQCGFCTSIGCFHIKKLISTINVPPIEIAPEKRVSEATLCFYKSFWENRSFQDSDFGEEAAYFLKNRYHHCINYPWRSVIVSLLHSNNISNRVKSLEDEPNGCHFGLSDELFNFITNLEAEKAVSDTDVAAAEPLSPQGKIAKSDTLEEYQFQQILEQSTVEH